MRRDKLVRQLLAELERERILTRRLALIAAPLILFPLMAVAVQMVRSGWMLVTGALAAAVLIAQFDLLTKPALRRVHQLARDAAIYLAPPGENSPRGALLHWPEGRVYLASLISACASLALFVPTVLAQAAPWQRVAGVLIGGAITLLFCARLRHMLSLVHRYRAHFAAGLPGLEAAAAPGAPDDTGLLDAALLAQLDAQPLPALRLSPAALALLRTEGYLLLRDAPASGPGDLQAALRAWAEQAHADELCHWLLPPVGGKIYLPCAAHGLLAHQLSVTMRRLGMDGTYSGVLGTWLVRLPPARSYAVAARLIDALLVLGILPPGSVLIHHLTVAGDLGAQAAVPALLHLMATPLVFEERPGHAPNDERPFIMRGGGVIDDLDRGCRTTGPRTDFVDGFLFVNTPEMQAVEHLSAHAINLRIKQVLGWAIYAAQRAPERRSPAEHKAAARFHRLHAEMSTFLGRYALQEALTIRWIDGTWSEQWPVVRALGEWKQKDPAFLSEAQALRDAALAELEELAVRATGQRRAA